MSRRNEIEELYELHFRDAARLASLILRDASWAEDVAQEAFLRAASRLGALRQRTNFRAYLHRTVVRTALGQQRAAGRRTAREQRADQLDPIDHADPDVPTALLDAIHALPVRQRTAVVLRYWLDLSEREIAAYMRCAPGTVKSTLSRAINTLRQEVPQDD